MSEAMSSTSGGPGVPPLPQTLEDQRVSLERRLAEGYVRIDEALRDGQDVTAWERFWIELLHQYESVCNELNAPA